MKKQARDAKLLSLRKVKRDQDKKERADKRKVLLANAEKYYNEYKSTEDGIVKAKRDAKAAGNYFVPAEPKVAFAIRTRG